MRNFFCFADSHEAPDARLNALISDPEAEGVLPRPAKTAYTTLRQIVQWIPEGLVDRGSSTYPPDFEIDYVRVYTRE